MTDEAHDFEITWTERALNVCLAVRAVPADGDVAELAERLQVFLASVPASLPVNEALAVHSFVEQTLCYVVSHCAAYARQGALADLESQLRGYRQALLQLVGSFAAKTASSRAAGESRVERALVVMEKRLADPSLHLPQLAQAVGVTASHLSHLLKSQTGMGFVRHLQSRKIGRAEVLLANHLLSVKEVAALSGYRNVSTFGRDFKKLRGVSPLSMRRGVRP